MVDFRVIKHLPSGELKVECLKCLMKYRISDFKAFKCPCCDAIEKTEIIFVEVINKDVLAELPPEPKGKSRRKNNK